MRGISRQANHRGFPVTNTGIVLCRGSTRRHLLVIAVAFSLHPRGDPMRDKTFLLLAAAVVLLACNVLIPKETDEDR